VAHHGAGLQKLTRDERLVADVAADPDAADLPPREAAMVAWALKLTRTPGRMTEADLEPLRAAGLDDRGILDLAMVTAYYAYVNRLASGLGVEVEAGGPPHASRDGEPPAK
jgi:uncharacterized peroxidase-related enzyme